MKKIFFILSILMSFIPAVYLNAEEAVSGPWVQNFEGGNVSDGWTIVNPSGEGKSNEVWKKNSGWWSTGIHAKYQNQDMIFFDSYNPSKGKEGYLISPVFIPGENSYMLEYTLEEYILAANYVKDTAEPIIYLEISTDGGATFETSEFNILSQIPNHNVKPANNGTSLDTLAFQLDLTEYIDQEIKVQFRAVSGCGGTLVNLWKVELLDTTPQCLFELDESFDNGIPEGWRTYSDNTAGNTALWKTCPGDSWPVWLEGREAPDGNFVFFETFTGSKDKEGFLETPCIKPTENLYVLSFEVADMLRGTGTSYVDMYVEISEDGGETYTRSNRDIVSELTQQKEGPTTMTTKYVDLADYTDKEIKIRFRASRPWNGGAYVLLDNVKLMEGPETPVLTINSIKANYTQIPASHSAFVEYKLSIFNEGYPVRENDAVMKVTTKPGDYSGEETIPVIRYFDGAEMTVSGVNISEAGLAEVEFSAEMVDGSITPVKATTNIQVTENVFALDSGVSEGTVGMNEAGYAFGNMFELAINEKIGGFSVAWGEGEAQPFNFEIYKVEEDGSSVIVYSVFISEELTKPATSKEDEGKFVEYFFSEPQTLSAGQYMFMINQTEATRIELCTDGNPEGMMYMINPNGQYSLQTAVGYALLRPYIATPKINSLSPEDGMVDVALDAPVTIEFTMPIESELKGITINGKSVEAEIENNVLTIKHAKFDYETLYTVNIPAGTIEDYDEIITWSFTTVKAPLEIVSLTPDRDAVDVALDAVISITFSANVEGSLKGIKLNGRTVNASAEGNVLTIAHDELDYKTEYTVLIPKGVIERHDDIITWSFTTVAGDDIANIAKKIEVFPTITKESVIVNTPAEATISVLDLSGRVMDVYHSNGNKTIDLNYADGIYLIVVNTEGISSSYKVILQK